MNERALQRPSLFFPHKWDTAFGRYPFQEHAQFCRQARGCLAETLDHLICACEEGYITKDHLAELREKIDTLWRLLNGYIRYLVQRSKARQPGTTSEPPPEYCIPSTRLSTLRGAVFGATWRQG